MPDDRHTRDRDTHVIRDTHVERDSGRSGSGVAFIVGGLVVAVLVIAYFLFGIGGGMEDTAGVGTENNITIEAPVGGESAEGTGNAAEGAADFVGDAAEGTGNADAEAGDAVPD